MRLYNNLITLNRNSRGVYDLDTIKGCSFGMEFSSKGCYHNCYAVAFAKQYGYDFSTPVRRYFKDDNHVNNILRKVDSIDCEFIRIGCNGDPSIDWQHTINVCKIISGLNKHIVIVTKHWNVIPGYLLNEIEKLDICINTSISALDSERHLKHRLHQFYKLKNVCKSVLRINSCDYNEDIERGKKLSEVQAELFEHKENIDNILRFNLNNPYVVSNVVNISKVKFLTSDLYASVHNEDTYFGNCQECADLCGTRNMSLAIKDYQLNLFESV